VPLLNIVWATQARRGREPTSLQKMAIGCVVLGTGFLVMIAASNGMAPGAQSHVMWLVVSSAIFTVGEIYLSPVGLSFVTKVAPARMVSMMMGVWYLSSFVGNYMTGYIGTFYEKMPRAEYFLMLAAIAVVAGLLLFVMNRPLDRIVGGHDRHEAPHG
jgi:POT family proton-dependent oligopeptide transporter